MFRTCGLILSLLLSIRSLVMATDTAPPSLVDPAAMHEFQRV